LQGFVVLAVEHADGTAAAVQLAGNAGYRFYAGWLSEEERMAQTKCAARFLHHHEHCSRLPSSIYMQLVCQTLIIYM
jgi:hypothetical protein